jgi:hypothetical protein
LTEDIDRKMTRFVCMTIRRVMKGKARLESQLKLYKIMAVPTAIFGRETCAVRKNHEARIQTAEMRHFL